MVNRVAGGGNLAGVPGRRMAMILAAGVAVALLAGCGYARTGTPQPRPEPSQQLLRALHAWSGFPVRASPRPLVITGEHVADPRHGFPPVGHLAPGRAPPVTTCFSQYRGVLSRSLCASKRTAAMLLAAPWGTPARSPRYFRCRSAPGSSLTPPAAHLSPSPPPAAADPATAAEQPYGAALTGGT